MDSPLAVTLARLRECAELYRLLAGARLARAQGADREQDLAALDAEYAGDLDAVALANRRRRAETRRLEDELKSLEDKLRDRRSRPASDASTALALAEEIAAMRRRRDELEQRLLAVWQDDDHAAVDLAAEAAAATAERERIASRRADHADRAARAERAIPELEGDLEHQIRQLPPRIGQRLRRVAGQQADPVADLVNGACAGCGQSLLPQEAVNADRETALVVCQGCGRYVVARSSRRTR
ncbi:MAG TPA: hypothetical protein PLL30_04915 [Candidatus Krumholzibacteria bacterium]|nr:hypothetical protein [Candidatus Krumholzibacteria bacterium]HPD71105.1 hypothetical protein [Candidatus Krumholzibacteria bacterium]HRY39195.1 hypothetical protein [Candidatus Krumholzibacteria bacterium]